MLPFCHRQLQGHVGQYTHLSPAAQPRLLARFLGGASSSAHRHRPGIGDNVEARVQERYPWERPKATCAP